MADGYKIAVIGCGAVGGYFGGALARAGADVHFLARGQIFNALRDNGLTVKSIKGDFHIKPVQVYDSIEKIGTCDLVILGVKSWQINEISLQLKPLLKPGTTILPLQNGIMAADELGREVGYEFVLGGLCRLFSKQAAPGVIDHFAFEPSVEFGELNGQLSNRCRVIQSLFSAAGVKVVVHDDIQAELWRKLLFICTGGLLAVTRSDYGPVRSLPQTRQLLQGLLQEIYELACSMGIKLQEDIVARNMAAIDKFPPDTNCSLTRDIWEGKPSELEYQNGTIVRLADEKGIEVPINRFIYYSLLPQERHARGLDVR